MRPYAPLYFSYVPPTVHMKNADDADMFKLGTMGVNWPGWGEETMLAGKYLQKRFPGEQLNLFWLYTSQWMTAPKRIAVRSLLSSSSANNTSKDFYLFNRIGSIQEWQNIPFPYATKPYMIVAAKGYAIAWVFRGSDLEASGDLQRMQPAIEVFR